MILVIDVQTKYQVAVFWPRKISKRISWNFQFAKTQAIINKINLILKKNKLNLKNLKAIGVYQGPGSYTGLRTGISVANTLGWVLNIPVIGIKGSRGYKGHRSEDTAQKPTILAMAKKTYSSLKKKRKNNFSEIILPKY